MGFLKNAFPLLAVLFVAVNSATIKAPAGGPACICTFDFRPVCGTDGNTYANLCEFKCARDEAARLGCAEIVVSHIGECRE